MVPLNVSGKHCGGGGGGGQKAADRTVLPGIQPASHIAVKPRQRKVKQVENRKASTPLNFRNNVEGEVCRTVLRKLNSTYSPHRLSLTMVSDLFAKYADKQNLESQWHPTTA